MDYFQEIVWSEKLKPEQVLFNNEKVEINFLPVSEDGLQIETAGFLPIDIEAAKKAGFDELDDPRYALREISQDSFGKVRAKVLQTTMGLYNRYHRVEKTEDMKDVELAMPVGGCVVLFTTEKDGSERMIVQYRTTKNDYSYTPGASAGGIMEMKFDDNGSRLPLEDVYKKHIAKRLEEEVGIGEADIDLKISGVITEKEPKAHHEIASMAVTNLSYDEVCKAYADRRGIVNGPRNLISLPATVEAIEVLVSKLDCPLPPSHLAAYISAGFMLKAKSDGVEKARQWVSGLEAQVRDNYFKIDEVVRLSGKGDKYRSYQSPAQQGLPDLINALWTVGLLKTNTEASTVNKVEKSEDLNKIDPSKAAITGSIHFPNFGTDPSDTVRGEQALRAIKNTLEAGFGVIANVSGITNADYRSKLESLKSAGRLILLDEMAKPDEDAHSYGVSRRQLLEESKKQGFEYVMSGELEKEDLLEAENIQKFLHLLNTEKDGQKVGMVVMNRKGIMEKGRNVIMNNASGLPEAQYFGEYSQNQYIWENWKNAGFVVPEVPLDLLNGTRFAANEEIKVKINGYDYGIRPTDVMELRYKYQNENEIGFPYKVDHYSAAIYHSPTLWIALAGENGIASAEIDYQHPEEQTRVEEMVGNREVFEKKRLEQKQAIVLQNFDLCCNIVKWKEEGVWPMIVMEAIKNKTALPLEHYDIRDWQLRDGKLMTKEGL